MIQNHAVVIWGQILKVDFSESIQEWLRESLAAWCWTRALWGVLARKHKEVRVADELLIQLRDIDCASMVQYRIETFQDRLLRQIHLIDQEPVSLFDCLQEDTITPAKLNVLVVVCVGYWVLRPQ